MAASYPSAVKTFATHATNDTIAASHPNDIQDEVTAVENGLLTGLAHDVIPDATANNRDLGSSSKKFRDLNLNRNASIGGTLGVTGAATLSATLGVTGVSTLGALIGGWTVVTTTSVGSQNNFAPGLSGHTIVRCNNASLLTITGLAGGFDGQHVLFVAVNAQVDFAYSSGSSSVGNKFINWVSSGNTSIVTSVGSGCALYVYDATSQVWRLMYHEQGGWIAVPFSAGNFTGSGSMTWTVDAGDMLTNKYYLRGRTLTWAFGNAATTVGGTVSTNLRCTIPGGYTTTGRNFLTPPRISDNGGATVYGQAFAGLSGSTFVEFYKDFVPNNWTLSTNATSVEGGPMIFEVQ